MKNKEEIARIIVERNLGIKASRIRQFPTGLSHFVFDISTGDGFTCVIRIARPKRTHEFVRGIKWHEIIESVGVQLPKIFEIGEIGGHHFAVYERLEGDDLENVYSSLSVPERKKIAEEVAEIQQKISTVSMGHFEIIPPWHDFLQGIVSRSEQEIISYGLCNPKYVDLVCEEIESHAEYFHAVQAEPLLYDLSVRNVIINKERVTGIIDVDDTWCGDPLLAIGRGKTILKAMQQDTEFIKYWCEYIEL